MSNCGKSGCKEEPLAADEEERVSFFIFLHSFTLFFFSPQRGLRAYSHLIVVTISTLIFIYFQATRCSFSGKIDSDPDSTVHISGCPEEESIDISLMSKKVEWMLKIVLVFDLVLDLVILVIVLFR